MVDYHSFEPSAGLGLRAGQEPKARKEQRAICIDYFAALL